ncbi:hypothetical protein CERSUDRAFT_95914 [Gelatoporia subvermispora B]|uniref:Uncharacterized protein n=1 Tax=Ceriporiopsis subvermispora (strain B) TaxID=914234 RepID=M2RCU4_CERS8|nr:hypothetical protein CERSUDRAFT_95914 [Gelatoporia subvermispora B]
MSVSPSPPLFSHDSPALARQRPRDIIRATLALINLIYAKAENGAKINIQGGVYGSALGTESFEGHLEIARLLIELGADVNSLAEEYGTAVHMAAYKGESEVVERANVVMGENKETAPVLSGT